jgi:Ice-binding-like
MYPGLSIRVLLPLGALCCLGAFTANANLADCGVDLGAAGPYAYGAHTRGWAAFTLGGGMSQQDDTSGSSSILGGDVGLAGNGDLNMSGSSFIEKDVWQHTGGTFTTYSPSSIHGTRFQDAAHDAILDQGVTDAMNADAAAFSMTPTYSITNISTGSNYTLYANADCTVLKLQNFKLSGGMFTLVGTATQHFIINVTNTFSLNGGAQIVLSGGLTFDNVLFNVHGTGSDVAINASSKLAGILMATQRTVKLTGSEFTAGEVIANRLVMSGSSKINLPPVVSQ